MKRVASDTEEYLSASVIHVACRGFTSLCVLLVEAGAKMELPNKRGLTPLGEAVLSGHVETAETLIVKGARTSVRPRG